MRTWRPAPRRTAPAAVAAITTKTGMKVHCELDHNTYPKGIKVSDAEMDLVTSPVTTFMANGNTPPQKPSPWSDSCRTGP
jgi:hypothetical protein